VVHPDGSIWFTDPTYGIQGNYEGFQAKSEIKDAAYRVDPKTGKMDKITDELDKPNGICFSPDYKKVYICDTGDPKDIQVFEVAEGKVRNQRRFIGAAMPAREPASPTGFAPTGRQHLGRHGVGGRGLRRRPHIRAHRRTHRANLLPETCANLCFGGAKRNRLFMAASQSLYSLYVGTKGAHIA